jgi:UDP-N-acetylmuramoyl-tripeptide--D-alanyl-D-alanine ligase
VAEFSINFLLTLGEKAAVVVESATRHGFPMERTKVVESYSEAVSILREMIQMGDWILVKGSRRMAMEKIVEALREGRA